MECKYNIIAKYLSNEQYTDASIEKLQSEDGELLKRCKNTWKLIDEMKEIEQFDTDKAWNKLHQKLDDEKLIPLKQPKMKPWNTVLKVAAVFILLLGLGYITHKILTPVNQTVMLAGTSGNVSEYDLPDGSKVFLNGSSKVEHNLISNDSVRRIKLSGEAFFDIVRDENKPFVVEAENVVIRVLGTSFSVNNTKPTGVEVIVESGRVEVCDCQHSGEKVVLATGEAGRLKDGHLKKHKNTDINYKSWINKKLVFKEESLNKAVQDISKAYYATVELRDSSLNNLLLTSTFDGLTLDEMLSSIAITFNLSIEKQQEKYILEKK